MVTWQVQLWRQQWLLQCSLNGGELKYGVEPECVYTGKLLVTLVGSSHAAHTDSSQPKSSRAQEDEVRLGFLPICLKRAGSPETPRCTRSFLLTVVLSWGVRSLESILSLEISLARAGSGAHGRPGCKRAAMLGASAESGQQSPSRCAVIREMINLFVLHCCYYYYAHKPELCKNFPAGNCVCWLQAQNKEENSFP